MHASLWYGLHGASEMIEMVAHDRGRQMGDADVKGAIKNERSGG